MKILFSLCSWGLGHATRSLPILRRLVKDSHEVIIYTSGRSLALLQSELKDGVRFIASVPYPSPYSDKIGFAFRFIKTAPKIIKIIKEENLEVAKIAAENKVGLIISDSRFGSYSKSLPSYLLFHQLRFIAPLRLLPAEMVTEFYNHNLQNKFEKIIVPDYAENSLSGDLSHNLRYFKSEKIEYIGILSDYEILDVKQDIDYLFSISGPEPTRTVLEEKLFSQLPLLNGSKIAVALGKPGKFTKEVIGNTVIYSYLEKARRDELMNRARIVVSRSGYTTVMDVAEINRNALFIPTPGQTEQVYLANHLEKAGFFHSVKQRKLKLDKDTGDAFKYKGYFPPWKTKDSVERFLNAVGLSRQ
ncbi:MAG: glycosyltransferase [Deltaproteobacteria bacterium]|nr:glycosyltransferase [Deltaproteobacteria bacterium]